MVADIEVDKVADIDIDMEIQFGERVGHRGWLIGPKLFGPKVSGDSSKLCEFIVCPSNMASACMWPPNYSTLVCSMACTHHQCSMQLTGERENKGKIQKYS